MDKTAVSGVNTINIKSKLMQNMVGASIYSNDDWGTIAFSFPRSTLSEKILSKELRYNCIYFLFGYDNSHEMVYVGQAKKRNNGESVLARLREHDKSTTDKYADKWSWVIAVTNKNDTWGLDDLNALEHALYNSIPSNQNLNGNNPNSAGANWDEYSDKIFQVKSLVTAIGFTVFLDKNTVNNIQVESTVNEYTPLEDLRSGMAKIPEIVTPNKLVKSMVDLLPADVWNSKTVFLDPACKGGEYLREIYDRLMDCELLQSEFPNIIERSNHILRNQIYGIALSRVSLERTTKKLMGEDRNIRIIPNYYNLVKGLNKGKNAKHVKEIIYKEFGEENMKVDVVIGNPPYNRQMYKDFIILGNTIAESIHSMIVPATWSDIHDSTHDIIKNKCTDIIYYPDTYDCFDIKQFGGISVYVCNQHKEKDTCNIINHWSTNSKHENTLERNLVLDNGEICLLNKAISIIEKVLPAGIENVVQAGYVHAQLDTYGVTKYVNDIDLYMQDTLKDDEDADVEMLQSNVSYGKISRHRLNTQIGLDKYKLSVHERLGYAALPYGKGNILGLKEIHGLKPYQIPVINEIILVYGDSIEDLTPFYKYYMSKFVRFLVFAGNTSSHYTHYQMWRFVPMQDFTSNSDINWDADVDDVTKQLYKKYNLTDEEIDCIESTIKDIK